jgi:hypothetical protein
MRNLSIEGMRRPVGCASLEEVSSRWRVVSMARTGLPPGVVVPEAETEKGGESVSELVVGGIGGEAPEEGVAMG